MKNKEKSLKIRKELFKVIAPILRTEDFLSAIDMGAPQDEYDGEAKEIADRIWFYQAQKNLEVITNIIYSIHIMSYCLVWDGVGNIVIPKIEYIDQQLGRKEKYKKLAKKIMNAVKDITNE